MSARRIEAFKSFGSSMKRLNVAKNEISTLNNSFDIFFAGSDQVWNPEYIRGCEDWFFLTFADESKRNSIAASIGLSYLTSRQKKVVKRGISGFSHISVREKRGAELIKECSGKEVDVICDPTLVLPAEEWRAIANGRLTPKKRYVFTYLLGGLNAESTNVLDRVTECGKIPVVPLSDRQKPGEPDAGPAEFIDLINHASHVVTDSFHAAVFSSILHTPLTIVHREGGASMFSRLEQLSETLGIEEKVYGSPSYDLAKAGDYKGIDAAIERERVRFMEYLKDCLDG